MLLCFCVSWKSFVPFLFLYMNQTKGTGFFKNMNPSEAMVTGYQAIRATPTHHHHPPRIISQSLKRHFKAILAKQKLSATLLTNMTWSPWPPA